MSSSVASRSQGVHLGHTVDELRRFPMQEEVCRRHPVYVGDKSSRLTPRHQTRRNSRWAKITPVSSGIGLSTVSVDPRASGSNGKHSAIFEPHWWRSDFHGLVQLCCERRRRRIYHHSAAERAAQKIGSLTTIGAPGMPRSWIAPMLRARNSLWDHWVASSETIPVRGHVCTDAFGINAVITSPLATGRAHVDAAPRLVAGDPSYDVVSELEPSHAACVFRSSRWQHSME
jgi:hypothetical protein